MEKGQLTLFLLTDGIPPYVMGGMQKHSRLLAEYVARLGVKVVLYHCVEKKKDVDDEAVRATFSETARQQITIRTFLYEDTGKLPGHYLRAQKRLSQLYFDRLLKETVKPDFIYTKGYVGSEALKRRNELPFSCKIGVKFHGMNMYQKQPDWKGEVVKYMLRPATRNIMNAADVVFSYGGKITRVTARRISKPSKIVEFPSGIGSEWIRDENELTPSDDVLRFLFVGRYDRLKGLPEIYRAIESIVATREWKLTLVGPIPEAHQLQHPNLEYAGAVYDEHIIKSIYDKHAVLLCPSISEGMPNVIMEAMARGLAVIATDVGATQVLVKEDNGWLILPSKTSAICAAMNEALATPNEKLLLMRKAGIGRMRNDFVWEEIAKRFVRWLEKEKE